MKIKIYKYYNIQNEIIKYIKIFNTYVGMQKKINSKIINNYMNIRKKIENIK